MESSIKRNYSNISLMYLIEYLQKSKKSVSYLTFMLEQLEKPSPTQLDTQYPIESVYQNLELEYPNLYRNICVEREASKPSVVLLTGLSGSGKDCVLQPLLDSKEAYHVVTATSRERRVVKNEPETAYVWMRKRKKSETEEQYFGNLRNEYSLIENDYHYGNLYGLPLSALTKSGEGIPVIRTDIKGVITLTDLLPSYGFQTVSIGVLPDSWIQVYQAILERGDDVDDARQRLCEDFNNMELYVRNVNYFLHNSREADIDGCCGLDISIDALRYLIKRYSS